MTAKELREALEGIPDDTPVLIAHQSRGYHSDTILEAAVTDCDSYNGHHVFRKPNKEIMLTDACDPDGEVISAFVIKPDQFYPKL